MSLREVRRVSPLTAFFIFFREVRRISPLTAFSCPSARLGEFLLSPPFLYFGEGHLPRCWGNSTLHRTLLPYHCNDEGEPIVAPSLPFTGYDSLDQARHGSPIARFCAPVCDLPGMTCLISYPLDSSYSIQTGLSTYRSVYQFNNVLDECLHKFAMHTKRLFARQSPPIRHGTLQSLVICCNVSFVAGAATGPWYAPSKVRLLPPLISFCSCSRCSCTAIVYHACALAFRHRLT